MKRCVQASAAPLRDSEPKAKLVLLELHLVQLEVFASGLQQFIVLPLFHDPTV